MSDIPRYKPVANDKFGITDDADGKLCEYRDYLKLEKECSFHKDYVSNCMKAVFTRDTEISFLKAEVERLTEANDCLDKMHEKEMARSAYLCEEVNRTTAWGRGLESDLSHARVEISFLKAEVNRLKADNEQLQARCNFLEDKPSYE